MNNKILFALVTLFLALQVGLTAGQSWFNYNDGMKQLKDSDKHLVIDFYADWCHWCKVMDKETFADAEVEKYLFENFVPIRLNAESTTEMISFRGQQMTPRQLTSAFQITGFPSLAFLTPDLEIITVIPGYIKKDMFLNVLHYMEHECYKSQTTFEEFLQSGCDNRTSK